MLHRSDLTVKFVDTSENVLQLVDEAMSHPVMPVPEDKAAAMESRSICMASLLHQADVALRKILGQHIAMTKGIS